MPLFRAGFLALLWPRLTGGSSSENRKMWMLAVTSAAVATILIPFLRPGLPVLFSALVAVAASLLWGENQPSDCGELIMWASILIASFGTYFEKAARLPTPATHVGTRNNTKIDRPASDITSGSPRGSTNIALISHSHDAD